MKFFVGTLFSGENEFAECRASISRQTHKDFEHFVFRDLPNREAHRALFGAFIEQGGQYEALVKVDADMVLARDTLFEEIVGKLQANPWAQVVSIAVHDFFSDQLIWGLNAYRNTVRWDFDKRTLFVDRPDVPGSAYLWDDTELAPAAYHCKNPSALQAFHYGVHRALKVLQPRGYEQNEQSSKTHWRALERTWEHFRKSGDGRLALATLGSESVYSGRLGTEDTDYSSSRLMQAYERFNSLGTADIGREAGRMRLLNLGFAPPRLRRKLLQLARY